ISIRNMRMKRYSIALILILAASGIGYSAFRATVIHVGKQSDGTFIVATGQHIDPGTIAFDGRPVDLALHPDGRYIAVLNQSSVFLATASGVVPDSSVKIAGRGEEGAAFRGIAWNPDGIHLYASVSRGFVQEMKLASGKLTLGRKLEVKPPNG